MNINFYFIVSASSFQEEGEPINPDLNKIDDLGTAIAEGMNDNDYIRNYVENVIYDVLEPDMKIMNVDDLYYSVSFYVNRIDGIETSSSDWGVYITRELFS